MVCSIKVSFASLVAAAALSGMDAAAQEPVPDAGRPPDPGRLDRAAAASAEPSKIGRVDAMIMLDYQIIPLPQSRSIDLMGLHVMSQVAEGISLGIGAYAPLVKGEYGGFMAFDIAAHARRKIWGNLFADAGLSVGGGGGGTSALQSIELSGTGGFVRASAGLGYDFTAFAVGTNVVRMKFKDSAIDSTRLGVFLQVPFSYVIGPYASFGAALSAADVQSAWQDRSETDLTLALVDVVQINPQGTYKSRFQMADFQFAQFMTPNAYGYASLAIGYQGLPLYNQMIGGLGYRFRVTPRLNLHAQLGLGSGGYAAERIDTGAGLLVYPKVSAEYDIARNLSLSLAAGYLGAAKGSSKNYTLGASLNYHIQPRGVGFGAGGSADEDRFKGYRLSLFQQTEYNVSYRDIDRPKVDLLTLQLDSLVNPHLYIPIQASIAYTPYLGYPAYGEVLAGVGLQTAHSKDQRFQFFGQLLAGANVHGAILKGGIGVNYGLSDQLAIHASAGRTQGPSAGGRNFRTDYIGLGMAYRFSVPGR